MAFAVWVLAGADACAGIDITHPAGALAFPESDEFAGMNAGKAWDMAELYDITYRYGFFEPYTPPTCGVWNGAGYDLDLPAHFHPLFRGVVSDPGYLQYFTRHAPGTPYGPLNPIAADYYNRLSFRHALDADTRSYCQITWNQTMIGTNENNYLNFADFDYIRPPGGAAIPEPYPDGFRIYDLDLTGATFESERIPHFSGWGSPAIGGTWAGTIYGFYIVPSLYARRGMDYSADWIRLYHSDTNTRFTLTWTNTSLHPDSERISLQLYVATNNVADEGVIFLTGIANDGALVFHTGALPPGRYYLYLKAVLDTGSTFLELARSDYSPPIRINARPTFAFTSPSFTSGMEYAAVERGNAWDMSDAADIDPHRTVNITSPVFSGGRLTATSTSGDPQIALSLLNPDGIHIPIPTVRYRYLTFRMLFDASPYPSSSYASQHTRENIIGAVARLQWVYTDFETDASLTKDLLLHEGWNDYTVDLWDPELLETRGAPPSAGWTNVPAVNYFIFHPIEPSVPISMQLDDIKLCAPNAPVNNRFPIRWVAGDADGDALTITLLYGTGAGAGFAGNTIVTLTNQAPGAGAYEWYSGAEPAGAYTIRAVVSDGRNTLVRDALAPVLLGPPEPQWPVPAIKANGASGSLPLQNGEPLTVTVELDAGDYAGMEADWWVLAWDAGNNRWYYLDESMLWIAFDGDFRDCRPAYQGPLFDLPPTAALSDFIPPAGRLYFYFAVDQRDDALNYPAGPIVYDLIAITVYE